MTAPWRPRNRSTAATQFQQRWGRSPFDTTRVNADALGFAGAAFDGRYVYLVPAIFAGPSNANVVARCDTQASFGAPSSWSALDLVGALGLSVDVATFRGAAFDGQYVYLASHQSSLVLRFDAKTPPSMPKLPGWNGSFF